MSEPIKCKIVSLATISLSYNTSTIRFMLDFTIFVTTDKHFRYKQRNSFAMWIINIVK